MDNNQENIKTLFNKINNAGLFQRLFGWKQIRNAIIDANTALQKLISANESLSSDNQKFNSDILMNAKDLDIAKQQATRLETENANLQLNAQNSQNQISKLTSDLAAERSNVKALENNISKSSAELASIKERLSAAENELKKVNERNTQLIKDEDFRKQEHSNSVASLNKIQEQLHNERTKEVEAQHANEIAKLQKQKETWSNHEEKVKAHIMDICKKHNITYIDKVPFSGSPDNTLQICDEYVIFDAKSPANDDLTNFPTYLKDQAEKAKKYTKQEGVKTDLFFVVPSNTLETLSKFVFGMADYNLFIVSIDTLEPLILSLQKIEDYEFAEQLSPEERENICRVIGKFAHIAKRRIQIDGYFANEFIELLRKSENDLPKDILEKAVEFEKEGKLNPPQEKRTKIVNIKELESETSKLKREVESRGIVTEDEKILLGLKEVPLYKGEK